jgi:hypothetical protein
MSTPLPAKITIGEKYGHAMKITTVAEATAYFEKCVQHCMSRWDKSRDEAEQIERANIGYYAGYYDAETAARVLELFGAAHPIFGTRRPTAIEAISAGFSAAQGKEGAQ